MVEKELLTNMKHLGIVKLRYSFQDKQSLYFVLEYCEGGDFINFIKNNISKLTEEAKIFYIAEMVNIIEYIHRNGVTHRDLKVFPPPFSQKISCSTKEATSNSSTLAPQKSPTAQSSNPSSNSISSSSRKNQMKLPRQRNLLKMRRASISSRSLPSKNADLLLWELASNSTFTQLYISWTAWA